MTRSMADSDLVLSEILVYWRCSYLGRLEELAIACHVCVDFPYINIMIR